MTLFIWFATLIVVSGMYKLFNYYKQNRTHLKNHQDVMILYRQFELAREQRKLGTMKNLALAISKVESDLSYIDLKSEAAASKHQEAA